MAQAKHIVDIAERVEKPPGTVEGHRRRGMWPADPTADLARHYEVMDACGLGSGRDDWAVAIEAALRFDWPTVKLRSVIVDPPPIDGGTLMARVRLLVARLVRVGGVVDDRYQAEGPNDTTSRLDRTTRTMKSRETHDDVVEGVVDDVVGGVERAVRGKTTTGEDFESTGQLVATTVDKLVEGGALDDAGGDTDRPISHDVRSEVAGVVERMPEWQAWAEKANPTDLIRGTAVAAAVVDLLNQLTPELASAGDRRRGEIAYLASWCGAEVVPTGFDQQLSTLGDLALLSGSTDQPADSPPAFEDPKE